MNKCSECDKLFDELTEKAPCCPYCQSKDIQKIQED